MAEFFPRLFEFIGNHPLNVITFIVMIVLWVVYETKQIGKAITPNELVTQLNNDHALVVDLRPNKDFFTGHIASAINMPYERVKDIPEMIKQYKDRSIIFVCANGRHSTSAQALLKKQGVFATRLAGGLMEWRNANMPLIKGAKNK